MMSDWLREIYVKRPDRFFYTSLSLLIYVSMRAYLTDAVKAKVKKTNSELAVIPGGITKELQPLNIGINRSFKAKLQVAWEHWMTDGEHRFTKTGRQRRANYATICHWIVDAWAKISVSTIMRSFRKAGIITEQLNTDNSDEVDSDSDETNPGMLDVKIAQLLNSDIDEKSVGFLEEEEIVLVLSVNFCSFDRFFPVY